MKAFLIARVSTEDQVDALPAQRLRLLEYADKLSIPYEIFEFHESAYSGSRDKFNAIIEMISASSELVYVVFDKIDRFTRDASSEEVRTFQSLCKSGKAELHFPSDGGLIINKHSSASDIMRLGLGMLMGNYYSNAISDNVKRRQQQMLKDGYSISKAPYGYRNVKNADDKAWIETDGMNAKAVQSIFKWYASGEYSLKVIQRKLKEEYGITKAVSQIDFILKNPFYAGQMRSNGKLYEHIYEKLISQELFERVGIVSKGFNVQVRQWATLPFVYRGLIKCADCSCSITFEKKKQKYVYGHCTQYKGKHPAQYISEPTIDKQIMELLTKIAIPDHEYHKISKEMRLISAEKRLDATKSLEDIGSQIAKLENRIEQMYDDKLDGRITEDLYTKKSKEYTTSILKLQKSKKNIELGKNDHYGTFLHLLNLSRLAPKLFEAGNFEKKRIILNKVLSNFLLSGDLLLWELKKPFDKMAFCADNSNWLGDLDSNQDKQHQKLLSYH